MFFIDHISKGFVTSQKDNMFVTFAQTLRNVNVAAIHLSIALRYLTQNVVSFIFAKKAIPLNHLLFSILQVDLFLFPEKYL